MSDELPPPLIQDPNQPIEPIKVVKKGVRKVFDVEKILAAVGLILICTIIILGGTLITLNRLEQRVSELEMEVGTGPINSIATNSARTATSSATPSAMTR